jgi:hypothetical protein
MHICEQKFGRKWNALRHSRLLHGSTSEIINVNNKPDTPYFIHNKYINYQKKFYILNQVYGQVFKEYDENISDIFDINKEDIKIIKIIDQLIKPFSDLEELLEDIDSKPKAFVLTGGFDLSIQSTNPVISMNKMVELVRSINGIKNIAQYRSMVVKTTLDPISDIKEKIKNSYLFESQNN